MRLSFELCEKTNQVAIVNTFESSYYCHIMNSCFIFTMSLQQDPVLSLHWDMCTYGLRTLKWNIVYLLSSSLLIMSRCIDHLMISVPHIYWNGFFVVFYKTNHTNTVNTQTLGYRSFLIYFNYFHNTNYCPFFLTGTIIIPLMHVMEVT